MSQTGSATGNPSAPSPDSTEPGPGTPIWKRLGLVICAILFIVVAGIAIFQSFIIPLQFPYGFSHFTDEHLMQALRAYADQHDGVFPAGETTPEATLSLLARPPFNIPAELLRGKSVPLAKTEAVLA